VKERLIAVSVIGLVLASLLLSSVTANPPAPTPSAGSDAFDLDTGLRPELTEIRLDRPELLPQSPASVAAPTDTQGWVGIMMEDFDGTFPSAGWTVFDNDGATNGEIYWGATTCFDFGESGDGDAVPHADGPDAYYTCWTPYRPNMNSWMVYGPFDLSNATDAELTFDFWLDSEKDHDYFKWGASRDGGNFRVYNASGSTNEWVDWTLDLADDPDLGDFTGESQVYIAFIFQSDAHESNQAGVWVDDIALSKQLGDCPGAATETYLTNTDNENNSHTGAPDDDMYPNNDTCIFRDNPVEPIEFNIVVPSLPSFTQAQLGLYAWDVDEQDPDCPERDAVYFNGHLAGYLTGANDVWSTSVFSLDPAWVQQGDNLVQVEIDTLNCNYEDHPRWCTKVDWGQLVLGGGGGAASIRSWAPLQTCIEPGSTANVQVEVDTTLSQQEIRVEVNILDADNNNLVGQSETKTIYGTSNDAFVISLPIPASAATGDYTLQVIVYDTCSETQNDYDVTTIHIDPNCGTATPVATDSPTPTATNTPTPTPRPTEETPMTWKSGGWDDYAPSGMPDFDQRQHEWDYPPGSGNWSYCGPLAVANCLWWFDSKFEPYPTPPPTINDNYTLLQSNVYPLIWDDHDPENLEGFVAQLAYHMDTDGQRTGDPNHGAGTDVDDMYDAVLQYLAERELGDNYTVTKVEKPTFEWVASEVERCEDVILLMGFWTQEGGRWERLGGHYVTTAGVDRLGRRIGFSDPAGDRAETGWPGRVLNGSLVYHGPIPGHGHDVHNDAGNVSHDIYDVVSTNSPGGTWGPARYAETYQAMSTFVGQNFPRDFPDRYRPQLSLQAYEEAAIQTEVEYAIAISPAPCTVEGDKAASPSQVEAGGETTVVITLQGQGDCPESTQAADVMLIIDRSGSMEGTPLQDAKNAAKTFVDMLDLSPDRDRVGVVSFETAAQLNHVLSRNGGSVKATIDGLSTTGFTNVGDGIKLANQQLTQNGRPGAAWITILLTDGLPNRPYSSGSAFSEADAAYARGFAQQGRADGITLYTIGLGDGVSDYFLDDKQASGHTYNPGDPAGHPYNQHGLAILGGGRYYNAPTSADLAAIYQGIAGVISAEPWTNGTLVDVLSSDATYIPGSASPPPYSISPDQKTLTWKIPLIRRKQTKTFSYRVRLSDEAQGTVCLNDSTQGVYTDSSGQPATVDIPPACVTVRPSLRDAFCKDHDTDNGQVPSNPNGEEWWVSPDIWVRHQQDGVPQHQNPQGGQTNHVYVKVRNRGNATLTNVDVGVYWAVGATSINWPNDWTYISTVTIPSLGPGQSRIVSVPWQPTASGHYCFLARIHAMLDPVQHEGLVPFDNNLCQRNVHVLPPEETTHDPYVEVGNPYGSPAQTDIELESDQYPTDGSVTVSMDQETFDAWQDGGGEVEGGDVVPGTTSISIDVGPEPDALIAPWARELLGALSTSDLSPQAGAIDARILGIPLSADEKTSLGLQLVADGEDEPELTVKQIVDGEAVGGNTYRPPDPLRVYLPLVLKKSS
jgi:hypothetical protein